MLQLKDDNGNNLPQEVQDRVNNFIDNIPNVSWFKPNPDLKKSDVEKQINFTLKCFWVEASIEYKTLKTENDWVSAYNSSWHPDWESAYNSAIAYAYNPTRASDYNYDWHSARDSDWDSAFSSTRGDVDRTMIYIYNSAKAASGSSYNDVWWKAHNPSRDSARNALWDSCHTSTEILVADNEDFKKKYPDGAFKQLFKLWEMWLYPVGVLKDTGKFTVYVPDIDLDTWWE